MDCGNDYKKPGYANKWSRVIMRYLISSTSSREIRTNGVSGRNFEWQ